MDETEWNDLVEKRNLLEEFLQEEKNNKLSGTVQAALDKIEAGNDTATPNDKKLIKEAIEDVTIHFRKKSLDLGQRMRDEKYKLNCQKDRLKRDHHSSNSASHR